MTTSTDDIDDALDFLLNDSNLANGNEHGVEPKDAETVLTFLVPGKEKEEEEEEETTATERGNYLILLPDGHVLTVRAEDVEAQSPHFRIATEKRSSPSIFNLELHERLSRIMLQIKLHPLTSIQLDKHYFPPPETALTAQQILSMLSALQTMAEDEVALDKTARSFASAPLWLALEANLQLFWDLSPPPEIAFLYAELASWRNEKPESGKLFKTSVRSRAKALFRIARQHPHCLSFAGLYLWNSIRLWPCAQEQI